MESLIYRYLKYGISYNFPESITIKEKTTLEFEEIKEKLNSLLNNAILKIKHPSETIFQLSGGFDSTLIASYFRGIKTICTGNPNSIDVKFSEEVSNEFKTWHRFVGHNETIGSINFKESLIEMNRINPYPRSFKNDFGLYGFLKYIKDYTKYITGGKGIEFQMIGYYTIYNKLIQLGISNSEYSIGKAYDYLDLKKYRCTEDIKILDSADMVINYNKGKKYNLDMVQWWNGTFTNDEIEKLIGIKKEPIEFNSIYEILEFIFEWFGHEYVSNRVTDYSNYFGISCIHPYLDNEFVDFIKTIPIEMKKCINNHKYIFYQAFGHRVPHYVIKRAKTGLNVSQDFFMKNYFNIVELLDEYLFDYELKIFRFLDRSEVIKYTNDFKSGLKIFPKIWALLNLSIWLEEHNENQSCE